MMIDSNDEYATMGDGNGCVSDDCGDGLEKGKEESGSRGEE